MSYHQWEVDWALNRKHERLGQAFVNDFIRTSWPELYYQEDTKQAKIMIIEYLTNLNYWPHVPSYCDLAPKKSA